MPGHSTDTNMQMSGPGLVGKTSPGKGWSRRLDGADVRAFASVYSQEQCNAAFVSVAGAYANPVWITSIDWNKLSSVPAAVSALSGTNTGDQTITLTGNVTGSGTGTFSTTIAAGAVTNSMLAGSIVVSKLAITGTPDGTKFLRDDGTWQVTSGGGTGVASLNGLTGSAQTFAAGSSGSEFAISSVGTTHTFNLPDAGATSRGVVTTGAQTFAGNKTFSGAISASNLLGTNTGDQDLSSYATSSAVASAYVALAGSYSNPSWVTSLAWGKLNSVPAAVSSLSGTNTGDQTITLTGDLSGSGTASFATTIAAGAVSLSKMADVSTSAVFYRKTAGTGSPEVQTLVTLKTDLGLTGTNTGDQDLSSYATSSAVASTYVALAGSYSNPSWITSLAWSKLSSVPAAVSSLSGTNTGDQTITVTGDLSGSGTASFATTIAAGVVSLLKMADVATSTVFYRKTAGTGSPEVQTLVTLKTDLGLTGTNTGDQDLSSYATSSAVASTYVALAGSYSNPSWITSLAWSKLSSVPAAVSSLSGTNTGDQDLSSYATSSAIASTYVPLSRTINGVDLSANRTLGTGTGGTDVNWSGLTLNIPNASAGARGLVSTLAQTFAGTKDFTGLLSTKNGTSPTEFRVHTTWTGTTDLETLRLRGVAGANFEIGPLRGSAGGVLRGLTIGGYATESAAITPWLSFTNAGTATFSAGVTLESSVLSVNNGNVWINTWGTHGGFRNRRASGTSTSPTQVLSNDLMGFYSAIGYHSGGSYHSGHGGFWGFYATEDYTATAQGTKFVLSTTSNGTASATIRLTIEESGVTHFSKLVGQTNAEITNTPGGTTQTIALNSANHQTLSLVSATGTVTVTLTVPTNVASGTIVVRQHGTTPRSLTWAVSSGSIKWLGTQPTWSSDAVNSYRVVSWRWNGSVMFLTSSASGT